MPVTAWEVGEMLDRDISASCILAVTLWMGSIALWGIGWIAGVDDLERLGLIVAIAGSTATIRLYFIDQHRRFKAALTVTALISGDPVRSIH